MANQRLNIDIVAKDRSTQALNKLQLGLSKIRGAVLNLQNAFIGLGAGLVIRNLTNTGKQLESLQVRLKFLFGSAQEGAKAFDNMAKFASRVPFSLEEIQQGAGVLSVVSKDAKELSHILEITGNVAAVTGLDFRTTAEQIQRSLSAGISAADLFRERGVKAMLGFSAGATVSVDQTVEAFNRVFGKGGRFGKATEDLAQTFEGTLSMIGDKIFNFKKTILEAGFFEGLKTQFGQLDKFLQGNAKSLDEIGRKIGITLAVSVEKLGNAIKVVKDNFDLFLGIIKGLIALKIVFFFTNVAKALMNVAKSVMAIGIGTSAIKSGFFAIAGLLATGGAVYVAFKGIDKLFKDFLDDIDELDNKMKNVLPSTRDFYKTMVMAKKEVKEIDSFLRSYENELSYKIPTATEKAIEKFKELNNTALENIKSKTKNIEMIIAEGINSGITKMSEGLARTIVFGESLRDTLKNMAQQVLAKIIAVLIEQIVREQILVKLNNFKIGQTSAILSLEKQITDEKRKQAAYSPGGSGSMGSSLVRMATSFLGFAKGGAVSKGQPVIVGERGAELFIPNQTGQITQSARGTGGGQTTVNFNINTVDASGFEELLIRSRGTITQLINSAVNERGAKSII